MNKFPREHNRFEFVLMMALAVAVVSYGVFVLFFVSSTYQIGIRTALTPNIQGTPTRYLESRSTGKPRSGDLVTRVGDEPEIRVWSDLLRGPGQLQAKITRGETDPSWYYFNDDEDRHYVAATCMRKDGTESYILWCELYRYPLEEMVPSLIWLFLKAALFIIGFAVYWKRPDDLSARRFYIVCVVTLGAYIGGYHWSYIAVNPILLIAFMICAVLLPVVHLHFYLTFPRPNDLVEKYPGRTLATIYGVASVNLAVLFGLYAAVRYSEPGAPVRQYLLWAIYGSFGLASLWYLACIASLVHSLRTVQDVMERNQVKCILVGVFFSLFPIVPSLYIVLASPDRFVEGAVTWPMFGASLMVTVAFAVGMTRYRLMELDRSSIRAWVTPWSRCWRGCSIMASCSSAPFSTADSCQARLCLRPWRSVHRRCCSFCYSMRPEAGFSACLIAESAAASRRSIRRCNR